MIEMYPIPKPAEEIRSTHFRTLKSYIGEKAVKMIMDGNGESIQYLITPNIL
jgi:hypothetical protein